MNSEAMPGPSERARVQRRTLTTLITVQVVGSFGMGAAPSVGILLAETVTQSEMWAGIARSGLTFGAALTALPLADLAARRGRRVALTVGWIAAAFGAGLLVLSPVLMSVPLVVVGMLALGVGTAAALQLRFAATDLALPEHRGRSLSTVVWLGTLGAVVGPNMGIPGRWVDNVLGLPDYAGAFLLSGALLALTSVVVWVFLRPDPLLTAQNLTRGSFDDDGPMTPASPVPGDAPSLVSPGVAAEPPVPGTPPSPAGRKRGSLRTAWRTIRGHPMALFAFVALVSAHIVMVSVMTMTPVHLHHGGSSIEVVGLTISFHVAGMFALAPVFGILTDRVGAIPTILLGVAVLIASAAINAFSTGHVGIMVGLTLLGLGWSAVTVPASSLLSSSVPIGERPSVQGLGDTGMNAAAAFGALASGPIMAFTTFAGLAVLSGLLVLPVVWHALRVRRR